MQHDETEHRALAASHERLNRHPLYALLRSADELRLFMAHHVFPVWDFMSLVKSLQATVAPTRVPWQPVGDPSLRRFINSIVLEEESDLATPQGDAFLSHFELYCGAMREVGADPGPALRFLELAARRGIDAALAEGELPEPARRFMRTTFSFIATGKPHVIAAALAHGREHVIPGMFRGVLRELGVSAAQAPLFHFYLERHIHLDEGMHAPQSLRLLDSLCEGDTGRIAEARAAAAAAIAARLEFWDGVAEAIACPARPCAAGWT
jgi:hypothetical protein